MTFAFRMGPYGVRMAENDTDLVACQALRHRCFFGAEGLDRDGYDARCAHVMIADATGLVATCRVQTYRSGRDIGQSYAAARYDLGRLAGFTQPMMELGRFCIAPRAQDTDVLRLLWGALTQIVDQDGIGFLFGCTSFSGVTSSAYAEAFTLLAERHLAPAALAPRPLSPEVVPLTAGPVSASARNQLPPLLRTYLGMGGWVSDHAVVDRQMQTLHVFTGLETAKVPVRRAAALRAMLA